MKLIDIWNAQGAWKRLVTLQKSPRIAYLLFKYQKRVVEEANVCECQRLNLVYQAAGVPHGTPDINLEQGSEAYEVFMKSFFGFLEDTSAELQPLTLSLDELIESLSSESGNTLSENELAQLEPFFTTGE